MTASTVTVRMLGDFSIRIGETEISPSDNRSRKIWLLLAYMIYYRNRPVSTRELIGLFWSEKDELVNPQGALKLLFHRARALLDTLGEGMGHTLIRYRDGTYAWNAEIPASVDFEQFEDLCKRDMADDDTKYECAMRALSLYGGAFLPGLAGELWVVPIAAHYHNLYVETVLKTAAYLEQTGSAAECVSITRRAVHFDPYNEQLYMYLMRGLLALEDQEGAVAVYDEMSKLLLDRFGIMPSDDLRKLYRTAIRTQNHHALSADAIRTQLTEENAPCGALICDYDFFRILCHAQARALARSGNAVHLAVFTLTGEGGASRAVVDRAVNNFESNLRQSLRRGDTVSRCSVGQFIVMLPQANYENGVMVAERVKKNFTQKYPHAAISLRFCVFPLEPNV